MAPEVITGLFTMAGIVIGSGITWRIQKDSNANNLAVTIEAVKTEHMAEKTALHYLNNKGYRDRSFEMLSKRLGGFNEDELRKILVRAGAVRYKRGDGKEYWRLLGRLKGTTEKIPERTLIPAFAADNSCVQPV